MFKVFQSTSTYTVFQEKMWMALLGDLLKMPSYV